MIMLKRPVVALLSSLILLSGCASRIPQDHFDYFAYIKGTTFKCSQKGKVPHQLYAQLHEAMDYTLGTWRVDYERFNDVSNQINHRTTATDTLCNRAASEAYQLISEANQHRQNRKATQAAMAELNESMKSFNRSMNSYNQSNQPDTNQGTWGMQPQQPDNVHCYETSRGDLICR